MENLSQINYYSLRDRNIRKILTLRSLGQILEAKMPRYEGRTNGKGRGRICERGIR